MDSGKDFGEGGSMSINKEETTMEIRITDNSPSVDLAIGLKLLADHFARAAA